MWVRFLFSLLFIIHASLFGIDKSERFSQYKAFYAAFQNDDNNNSALFGLAQTSLDLGLLEQANYAAEELIERDPKNQGYLLLQAKVFIAQLRYKDAGNFLAKLIPIDPTSAQAKEALKIGSALSNEKIFPATYLFKLTIGYDTNPGNMNRDVTALNDYLAIIPCMTTSCNYNIQPLDPDFYTELFMRGNYIHDIGKAGGFYNVYNWMIDGKLYSQTPFGSYLNLTGGIKSGYTARWGEPSIALQMGYNTESNGYINPEISDVSNVFTSVKMNYAYFFQSGSSFNLGVEHYELIGTSTSQVFMYTDLNGVPIYGDAKTRTGIEHFFIQYNQVKKHSSSHIFRFYNMHRQNFNDYHWYNYADFDANGIFYQYRKPFSAVWSMLLKLTLEHRRYFDTPVQGDNSFVPIGYDYAKDPDNLMRKDDIFDLRFEVHYKHSAKTASALGARIETHKTEYVPAQYQKYELYYSYYWLP